MDSYCLSEALIEGVVLLNCDSGTSYTLERRVGEGRFRQVWRAVDAEGQPFALKMQVRAAVFTDVCDDEHLRSEVAAESLRCQELSSNLSAFVPQFLESFCIDRRSRYTGRTIGLYVIVMEYIDGISLDKILRVKELPEASVAFVLKHVCEALQQLHRLHIVHHGVKAENLMISSDGRVYLCDLGYLKQMPEGFDERVTAHGTPCLTDPEVALCSDHSLRVDVRSIGTTAIQLLAGRRVAQPMAHIVAEQPHLRLSGEFSRDARHFVAMCLKEAPTKRVDLDDLLHSRFLQGSEDGELYLKEVKELGEKILNFYEGP